ncbi:hypothetical protein QQ045_020924 [Rhodiola kirilowii]
MSFWNTLADQDRQGQEQIRRKEEATQGDWGQPHTVRSLTDLVRFQKPKVIGLIKTKMDGGRVDVIRRKAGGLVIWWREETQLTVRSYSEFHIDFEIELTERVRLTIFYGNPVTRQRNETWNLLRNLGHQNSLPWIVLVTLMKFCSVGGVADEKIREAVEACGLIDPGYKGLPFMFSNKRAGILETKARLDRAFGNLEWKNLINKYQVTHLVTSVSDHLPHCW